MFLKGHFEAKRVSNVSMAKCTWSRSGRKNVSKSFFSTFFLWINTIAEKQSSYTQFIRFTFEFKIYQPLKFIKESREI